MNTSSNNRINNNRNVSIDNNNNTNTASCTVWRTFSRKAAASLGHSSSTSLPEHRRSRDVGPLVEVRCCNGHKFISMGRLLKQVRRNAGIQVALMAVLLLKCCDRCYKDHEPHYCQHYIQYYHWYVSSTMIYDKTHQNNNNNNT